MWDVLAPHAEAGRGSALALRLMAAVHRLVLSGEAPALAAVYPSAGGDAARPGAWPAFRDMLSARAETLRGLVARPCQTNEVGRCAALVFGFLEVAHRTRRPLRLLEVGASAGLNLRWDLFRYGNGAVWGRASPVDLTGLWDEPPLFLDAPVSVAERSGCDLHPLDPLREDDRLTLLSSVWADQTHRVRRLRGAFTLAERVPARVDAASLVDWLPPRLDLREPGLAAVVFHSVVEEYVPEAQLAAFRRLVEDAGARADGARPLAWLRLEPEAGQRRHLLTLRLWPGGEERALARCGAHGTNVRRA